MKAGRRIDFLVIGAQKGGTTALFDHLTDDPNIGLSDVKEVHFFDDEGQDWSDPDYDVYHARFDFAAGRTAYGEATPIYIYWPNCLERIQAYRPEVRLILMLRDPVERAWSHWRMETARGSEREPFAWCIRRGRARLLDSEPWGFHREFSYVERGFYGEQVERLFGLFPPEQVLIERSERLRQDPSAVLGRINRFLGVPAPPPTESRAVHVGSGEPEPPAEDAAFLRELYARDDARLKALTGVSFA